MASFQEYKRRSLIPLAGAALAVYYAFVFLPLDRRAQDLDAPLRKAWDKLAGSLEQSHVAAIDFLRITNQLQETRQALARIEAAKQQAAARLELSAPVRARMNGPFQLVEYQNERSKQMDELIRLAKQRQVTVEPAVLAGFPEHTADVKQPELLWAALSFIDRLLSQALESKVSTLHALDAPLALTNAPPAADLARWAEIPLEVEFSSSAGGLASLLRNLPLRGVEAAGTSPAAPPADKPPLFVDRLIIKRQSPSKPDEVRVLLRVIGFVLRE